MRRRRKRGGGPEVVEEEKVEEVVVVEEDSSVAVTVPDVDSATLEVALSFILARSHASAASRTCDHLPPRAH